MKLAKNIILNTDSYKCSQWQQYPAGTERIYSYIESRGGRWKETVFFGLQAFLREYLSEPITMADIDIAEKIITAHGEPFNRAGWEYIVKQHGGKLPVEIRAVPEGTVIETQNVLVTIVNTDPECYWLTSYLETALLRAVWYPTTVATNSYSSKQIIQRGLEETGDPSQISFKLHDFGARGVSSQESAALGGAAHLINFMGTDTMAGILAAMEYYDAEVCGFSIPAMEHSTVTSWGRENEVEAYRNMLSKYAKPGALLACVSDSYDIYNACKLWGTELKQQVIDSGAMVVIRPDSGDPATVVVKCARILDEHFGHTLNDKRYRVLNNVRIIQGDGIDDVTIRGILLALQMAGYSADNVAFGQGGALLQQVNRDTLKFAMKCSAAYINGAWRDVYKDPVTDSGKRSKRGRLQLIREQGGEFQTVSYSESQASKDQLQVVYRNGELVNQTTFQAVRDRAAQG
jgi:nicotinamide phosphoribosyltransferase|nr:nicotinate phosphoribosyltransferase [Oxalobacteraceae bacterium]